MNNKRMFRFRISCPDWMDLPVLILFWVVVIIALLIVVVVSYLYSWWWLLLLLFLPWRVMKIPKWKDRLEKWENQQE